MHWQVTEVGEPERSVANLPSEGANLLVRQLQELFENAELVEDFQRRRVNGVAAKIPEKIRVLLEHRDADTRTCEQKPKHHPGGSATNNATVHGLV